MGTTYGLPSSHGKCPGLSPGCNANTRAANTTLSAHTFSSPVIKQLELQRPALVPAPGAAENSFAKEALAAARGGRCLETPLGPARVSNMLPYTQTTKIAQWSATASGPGFQDERSLGGPLEQANIDRFVMFAKPSATPTFSLAATDSRAQMDAFYQSEFMNACRGKCDCGPDTDDSNMI